VTIQFRQALPPVEVPVGSLAGLAARKVRDQSAEFVVLRIEREQFPCMPERRRQISRVSGHGDERNQHVPVRRTPRVGAFQNRHCVVVGSGATA
jgi:hypothetical protein